MVSATLVVGVIIALVGLVWLGFNLRSPRFARFGAAAPAFSTVPLPDSLPAPVVRFFEAALGGSTRGDGMPVIESAVFSGRGYVRIKGLRLPARFRFTHQAGQGYRHYIELTFFGFPIMRVNEWYLDGHCRMELPVGVIENDAKTDSAANLGLWSESVFLPSIFLTDPRVRWEPIDATHARLVVPYGEETDSFDVTFDAGTGLLQSFDTLRWKEPASAAKTPWRTVSAKWRRFAALLLPASFSVAWGDEPVPWLVGELDEVVYNVDVAKYIRASGP